MESRVNGPLQHTIMQKYEPVGRSFIPGCKPFVVSWLILAEIAVTS